MSDFVVVNAAGRAVFRTVLSRSGPKVGLCLDSVSKVVWGLKGGLGPHMVDERISCDIVIAGQFVQCQTFSRLDCRRR